ncbi:MAG: hypothetical protein ABH859_06230 [Pseudomonadota bacterium]
MKQKVLVSMLVASLGLFSACGGSGSGGSSGPNLTDISALPKATSPMASAAAAQVVAKQEGLTKAATTGMAIQTTDATFFQPPEGKSRAACEMFNLVKGGVSQAAQADMILCFIQYMDSQGAFDNLVNEQGQAVNVYDGNYHVANLDITGLSAEESAPSRVKLKITKNTAGSITDFEMFMCWDNQGTLEQREYTRQTISGGTFTMGAKGMHEDQSGTGWHQVDVTGTLNSSSVFTNKTIAMRDVGNWSGNTNWQEGTLTQTPANFTFSGYRYGNWADAESGYTGTNGEQAYGAGEMLGDTSTNLNQLAMGDGAVNHAANGTWQQDGNQGTWEEAEDVAAWLGDTAAPVEPATDSPYHATAQAGTMPDIVTTQINIAFDADETWDCTDDVGQGIADLPQMDGQTMNAACSQYVSDHQWINCWEIFEQPQQ